MRQMDATKKPQKIGVSALKGSKYYEITYIFPPWLLWSTNVFPAVTEKFRGDR